jgi:hypothetical protein
MREPRLAFMAAMTFASIIIDCPISQFPGLLEKVRRRQHVSLRGSTAIRAPENRSSVSLLRTSNDRQNQV